VFGIERLEARYCEVLHDSGTSGLLRLIAALPSFSECFGGLGDSAFVFLTYHLKPLPSPESPNRSLLVGLSYLVYAKTVVLIQISNTDLSKLKLTLPLPSPSLSPG
jgi:hypothetical protein